MKIVFNLPENFKYGHGLRERLVFLLHNTIKKATANAVAFEAFLLLVCFELVVSIIFLIYCVCCSEVCINERSCLTVENNFFSTEVCKSSIAYNCNTFGNRNRNKLVTSVKSSCLNFGHLCGNCYRCKRIAIPKSIARCDRDRPKHRPFLPKCIRCLGL